MKRWMLEELKNLGNRLFSFSNTRLEHWRYKFHMSIQNHSANEREWRTRFQHLKKDQVLQLSENEFSDAAENMCSVYRKLDLRSESRKIALIQSPGLFWGWGEIAEYHWIRHCVLTKVLRTFPWNFQDQDRRKQDKRKTGQKKCQKISSKTKNWRKETKKKPKIQWAENSSEDITRSVTERRKGGRIEEQDQTTAKHSSWEKNLLATLPHFCLTAFIPYILVHCVKEDVSHSG